MNSNQTGRQPGVLYGRHVQAAKVALGESIDHVRKIYLDTNFWLRLRDVILGRNENVEWQSMHKRLIELVEARVLICPLSMETFREIFLQTDINTLSATLKLVDQLSQGVCLLEPHQRMYIEAFHFIRKQSGFHVRELHQLNHLVWTRVSYAMGQPTPVCPELPEDVESTFQISYFDYMWNITLSDMIEKIGGKATEWNPSMPDTSKQMNEDKSNHINDYRTFEELFLIELRGILDCHTDSFSRILHSIYERDFGKQLTDQERLKDNSGISIANCIYEGFRQGKWNKDLPTFFVYAKLHASMRWDRQRKYKPNDMADIRHASTAIPYCDFFFTERSLCHLVSNKATGLAGTFACQTHSNVQSALNAIQDHCPQADEFATD